MRPDPVRGADTAAWLSKADDDLRAAHVDLAAAPPLTNDALFPCQQSVEKAMEALLTWHDQPFRQIHDPGELGGLCVAIDPSLEALLREVAPLTEFAWRYRYPGDAADAPLAKAASATGLAHWPGPTLD